MAVEWKNVLTVLGVLFLLFFVVPIRINKPQGQEIERFEKYLSAYNKTYGASEYQERFLNFKDVLKRIEELNANRTSNESALYGLTQFSDLSPRQFREKFLVENHHIYYNHSRKHHVRQDENSSEEKKISKRAAVQIPLKVDWREKGIINDIRDQKSCGACWAFSTIENVESMTALKTGELPTLSVQEVIDCARNGNMGCRGGDPCNLLEWLVSANVSIVPENNYPLKFTTSACLLKRPTDGIRVADFTCKNLVGEEEEILKILAKHGPVSVAVNALTWQFYTGGVIQFHCDGGSLNLNHVVQLVGYDRTASIPHYIARNSWGKAFGDNGYAYIAIGKNICGLGTEVSSLDVLTPTKV